MPRINAGTVAEHRNNQRNELIKATKSIFEKSGVGGITFGAVADKAGLARPSVYEYFKSKSDLLLALAEEQFPIWKEEVENSILRARTPEAKFEAFFSSQLKMLHMGKHTFAFDLINELDDKAKAKVHEMHLSLFEMIITPMQELGLQPTSEAFQLIGGVLHSAIGIAAQRNATSQKLAHMAATFVLGGFKALLTDRK